MIREKQILNGEAGAVYALPEHLVRSLTALANETREHCGFILKNPLGIMHVTNDAEENNDFRMNEVELLHVMTNYMDRIIGVFHTHPSGRGNPSTTDIEYASPYFRYYIVTKHNVYQWVITHRREIEGYGRVQLELVWHAEQYTAEDLKT